MSPITDIAPSLPTLFRLRMGRTVEKGGKLIPTALDGRLRVTSPVRVLIEAVADSYGGSEITEWPRDGGSDWETVIDGQGLRVLLIPGQALSQWWERWDSGGCLARCDGLTETLSDTPCSCPPVKARLAQRGRHCVPVTRLTVVLPKLVARFGAGAAGRLDAHGIIAAGGMAASLELAQAMLDEGRMVRGLLTIKKAEGRKQYVYPELVVLGAVGADELPAAGPGGELSAGEG